jgi:large subunit ribosomal protein L29
VEAYEIRALSDDEMRVRLHDVQEAFFNLRFQLSVGQLENHTRIRAVKRDVARLKTILRERELEGESA